MKYCVNSSSVNFAYH